jgi:flagellar basal-body rod modification protein FlgD
MKLLVAELQNQNPLEPKSNQEMGSSLAQFSQLDQLESMNNNIAKMAKADDPANKLYSASLIGKNVRTESVNINHEKGNVDELSFQIASPASKVDIKILDTTGTEIKNIELASQNSGLNNFKWDGRDSRGDYVQSGRYTYEIKATSEHGASLQVARGVSGLVESVEYSDDKVNLLLDNGNKIRLEDVKTVNSAYKGQIL